MPCFHTALPHSFSIPIFQIWVYDPHPRDGGVGIPLPICRWWGWRAIHTCHFRSTHVLLSDMCITKFSKSVVDEHDVNQAYCLCVLSRAVKYFASRFQFGGYMVENFPPNILVESKYQIIGDSHEKSTIQLTFYCSS